MMTAMVVTTKSMMAATKTRMSFFKKLEVPAKKMMMIKKRIIGWKMNSVQEWDEVLQHFDRGDFFGDSD